MTSFILHLIAMSCMLIDHMWATLFPYEEWMTCVGRIAFPIFAFMIVEGFFHTSNVKKYLLRLLIFALIAEIPFNLIYASSVIYPYHQNVLWTFLISLLFILLIEKVRAKCKWWISIPLCVLITILGYIVGMFTMVDYYGSGILTVLMFYFLHERKWWCYILQIAAMYYINVELLGGYYYDVNLFGRNFELKQQGIALLSLIPIWMYKGKQGYHKKWFQYFCYAFYPGHLLILYIIWQIVI